MADLGPTHIPALKVRVGWHVDLYQSGEWSRVVEVIKRIDPVATSQAGRTRYREVTIRLVDGRFRILSGAASIAARPAPL